VDLVKIGYKTLNLDNVAYWIVIPAMEESGPADTFGQPPQPRPSTTGEVVQVKIQFVGLDHLLTLGGADAKSFVSFVEDNLSVREPESE
jgi:hypothetical protein